MKKEKKEEGKKDEESKTGAAGESKKEDKKDKKREYIPACFNAEDTDEAVKNGRKALKKAFLTGDASTIEKAITNLSSDSNKDGALDKVIEQCKIKVEKLHFQKSQALADAAKE